MTDTIRITRDGPVATVTLTRPEVHNAFNEQVIEALHAAFLDLGGDASVRVIVLAGEGKSFSAGADLDWMRRMAEASEEQNRADSQRLAAMLGAIADCPKPVVARVHGAALGGGAGLAAASDIAIAGASAVFGFTEVRLGLVPATIAPHVVEKIGVGRALPLFLLGERFDAEYAEEIGLVLRKVADADLDRAIDDVVQALLSGGSSAQAVCKKLVRAVAHPSSAALQGTDADTYTSELIASVRSSVEGREGVAAFLEKRKPTWTENA